MEGDEDYLIKKIKNKRGTNQVRWGKILSEERKVMDVHGKNFLSIGNYSP